jgi:DNA-binding transcriptional ArsR family regulator
MMKPTNVLVFDLTKATTKALNRVVIDLNSGDLFDNYPNKPGWKITDTSRDAAQDMDMSARTIRARVLTQLEACPMTADQVAEMLSLDRLSVRPRLSELRAMGLIEDTGTRDENRSGKMAIVWGAK